MICAFPIGDGEYRLWSLDHSETYYRREKIKAAGGKWDGRSWTVEAAALEKIGAQKMVRVIAAAHCHMPEETIWATEAELAAGQKRLGCPNCDTSEVCGDMVKISAPVGGAE